MPDPLLKWHDVGQHLFEQGVDNLVLYPWDTVTNNYGAGIAWPGVVSIDESPTGGDANPRYADNRKYLTLYSDEELGLTLNAFMYPPEFEACDGTKELAPGLTIGQQTRGLFALSYRTKIGNEVNTDLGYKYHFVYGCKASPAAKSYATTGESPDTLQFSWTVTTTKVDFPGTGNKPSSQAIVDSTKVTAPKLAALLDIAYGEAATTNPVVAAVPARMPTPAELVSLINAV